LSKEIHTISCQSKNLQLVVSGSLKPMPEEWIDKDTGHRVMHLIPGDGDNRSFYFHNNPFVPANGQHNDIMIFNREVGEERQLFSIDLKHVKYFNLQIKNG
jgi:oligogalacturonide lyase